MTDEYATLKARVETEGELGYNEDNWNNTTNPLANAQCPNGNPFVEFGTDSQGRPLKWWINYQWTKKTGTYAWGDGWFRSNFDPKQFFQVSKDGLTLRAFGTQQDKCITSELVSSWVGSYGDIVVTARVDSGARSFAKLDPNAIFGLFTYQWGQADPAETPNIHREYDLLETISVVAQPERKTGNAQFAVQPATADPNNIVRFTIPDTQYLTAWMFRQGGTGDSPVLFSLFAGNYSLDDIRKKNPPAFAKWKTPLKFTPNPGNERFHISLYLARGMPPGEEQRVTITRINAA